MLRTRQSLRARVFGKSADGISDLAWFSSIGIFDGACGSSAREGSASAGQDSRRAWGFVPTLQATLAESPVALQAYTTLIDLVAQSTLTPAERQVAFLAVSVMHGREYCVAGHTYLARGAGVPEAALQALRERASR